MKRTHNNGELRLADAGKTVVLEGWVAKRRNFGALVFIDLRDRAGITQLVFDEQLSKTITEVRNEYVLCVTGTVVERQDKNPKLPTGDIEIRVTQVEIVNSAETTPLIIADETDALEDTRLKYRYLDLRRPCLQKNLMLRHQVTMSVRNYLSDRRASWRSRRRSCANRRRKAPAITSCPAASARAVFTRCRSPRRSTSSC
ncbi:MAG: OB-fold nucleic acid binding domain-containing protein [Merdibacter sp.]